MMQALGGVLVAMLVGALLAREAAVTGLMPAPGSLRRGLTLSIIALTIAFLAVVILHLATLWPHDFFPRTS